MKNELFSPPRYGSWREEGVELLAAEALVPLVAASHGGGLHPGVYAAAQRPVPLVSNSTQLQKKSGEAQPHQREQVAQLRVEAVILLVIRLVN